MKCMLTGVLLLAVALTTGCWDTVTTMSPGETIELDEMTLGDEYVIDSCQITRTAPGEVVLISASSLSIFSEYLDDKTQAKQRYLNQPARVEGLVTDATDWASGFADDEIEITFKVEVVEGVFDDVTVHCDLNTDFTAAQLVALLATKVTVEGKIDSLGLDSVWLYDCSVVPAR